MRKNDRNSSAKRASATRKQRRTFTLSSESVALLNDLRAARQSPRRNSVSAVLDDLLRALDHQWKRDAVDRAVTSYYDGVSDESRADETAWGEFSLGQFMESAQ